MNKIIHEPSSCQRRLASNREAPPDPNAPLDPSLRWGDGEGGNSVRCGSLPAQDEFSSVVPLVPAQAGIPRPRIQAGFPPARERAVGAAYRDSVQLPPALAEAAR